MTDLIDAAIKCAHFVNQKSVAHLFNNFDKERDGLRIVALGLAETSPSGYIHLAIEGIQNSKSAFEQFHALNLAQLLAGEITTAQRTELLKAIQSQIGNTITQADMSRWSLAQELLKELSKAAELAAIAASLSRAE
jgi:hypothetical protein